MLVLTRKETEQIVIGGEIVITINRIFGGRVSLGINAPRDMKVLRGEIAGNQPQIAPARIHANSLRISPSGNDESDSMDCENNSRFEENRAA